MTRIILVRHGQTAWNVGASSAEGERFRGRIDLPLNERGRAQAPGLGRAVGRQTHRRHLCQSLTARRRDRRANGPTAWPDRPPFGGHHGHQLGDWQERPHSEVARLYPALYHQWLQEPHLVRPPGGESLEEVPTGRWPPSTRSWPATRIRRFL